MTVKKQDVNAVKTMLKHIPAAKLTAFLTSKACAQQAGAEKMCFASQSLGVLTLQTGHQLFVLLLVFFVSLLLVAFPVGKRYSGKNYEVEMRILKQTLENALWSKEGSRGNDEMIRKRKSWNRSETADQLENPKVPIDEIIIRPYGECFHVTRDCKAIVDMVASSRRKCNWCCGV